MATLLRRPVEDQHHASDDKLQAFLTELGDVSRRHGMALTPGATVYMMEPEDFARSYLADDESQLTFA